MYNMVKAESAHRVDGTEPVNEFPSSLSVFILLSSPIVLGMEPVMLFR